MFIILESNLFHNTRSFENWEIFLDVPQFQLGNIQSCDVLRQTAFEQKYLMDYNLQYPIQIKETLS